MEKVSIVTAFFDLNRGGWASSTIGRNDYLNHFAFWAKLRNHVVVYTDSNMASQVRKVRERYGLLDLTNIIVVDDYSKLDTELLQSIKFAMHRKNVREFHLKPNNPESWSPEYNYVMLLKSWCVCDAIKKGLVDGMVAWLDFGFNKSGALYIDSDDFDFEWKINLSNKVHYFTVNKMDDIAIYEIIQRMDTYIQGGSFIAPATICPHLWDLMRSSMFELNSCGLCDDDQVLMLMAYRKEPDLFEIHQCQWFGMFDVTTPGHFKLRSFVPPAKNLRGFFKRIRLKVKTKRQLLSYLFRQYQILSKRNTLND